MTIHDVLWNDWDSDEAFPQQRPLLAHYTTMSTLDQIMTNDELWFSHPLNMNDYEELRYGLNQGISALKSNDAIIQACERKIILEH